MIKGLNKVIDRTVSKHFKSKINNNLMIIFANELQDGIEQLLESDIEENTVDMSRDRVIVLLEGMIRSKKTFDGDRLKAMNKLVEMKNYGNEEQQLDVVIQSFGDAMSRDKDLSKLYESMLAKKGLFLCGAKNPDILPKPRN